MEIKKESINFDSNDVLLSERASLLAANEKLRKEIAENEQLHSLQLRTLAHPGQLHGDWRRRGMWQKPESYKTVICQAWLESKTCTFAENCRFAHGEEELRPSLVESRPNNKYKTKLCDKYTNSGLCPYGKRCLFIHPDHGPNAYIRADKLLEVSQRHALADLRDQMEQQIMSGRPVTPDEPAARMPLGPTPVSTRGGIRAPAESEGSIWPLEPTSFLNLDMISRPATPLESMYAAMFGKRSSTPGGVSGYSSAGSTPSQDVETSPLTAAASQLLKTLPIQEPFSPMPGFDRLAEDMAKHLDLW